MKPTLARSPGAQAAGPPVAAVRGLPPDVIAFKVWELPVRISHWLMVAAIIVLCVTGYMIGRPLFSAPTEASKAYVHGTLRFVHYVAAWALTAAFMMRLYWGFAGNRFSRWSRMLPLRRRRIQGVADDFMALLLPWRAHRVYTGHAPLANLIYLSAYLGVIVSIVTGSVHYAQSHYTPLWRWIAGFGLALFGNNLNVIHLVHHQTMWFFVVYAIGHVYMVTYTMVVSRTAEVDTMISGRKFIYTEDLSPYDE
jgi:Ni/Fe-hydrogenase 1 B-type cytochrome subunit